MYEPDRTDQRAIANVVPIALWTLIWAATLAAARFGPDLLWGSEPVATWIAVAVNVAAGVAWIVAHARWLQRVDDLQRKIVVDGMAVALGVGIVGGFAYSVADRAGLVSLDVSAGLLATLMALVYAVASVVGTLRYR